MFRPTPVALKRSVWKGPNIVSFPVNLQQALKNKTPIRTQQRSCQILPSFVGLKFLVHNGMNYMPVDITDEMVGHKLGEFVMTRTRFTFRQTKAR
ncbi:mitochondrial ribosomal small subunit component [Saitoella coloradoensis]|uniref:Small ribosomal subunit protein uS19m n=1 Tax=Saitoella complicata (strain BCRC 22490 / CBS 7301 / JCM 7358 / NBRC 10748 / NRRL Y-17804) TaxID=698492 RepID=A0A0E9NSA2_SAICN|nr:ribosomal protein S19/S15 [Saitoella complicata NRRL Y-17804]ODQ52229.1 ribosomal protein S19/S15 [Saitoella complicata NRRL Y-17804]GAO52648.1 hypothetical protein G7K_6720-t1 [Saitoella complicata NRRL Y-17804]